MRRRVGLHWAGGIWRRVGGLAVERVRVRLGEGWEVVVGLSESECFV